jgi:hypothetical protein
MKAQTYWVGQREDKISLLHNLISFLLYKEACSYFLWKSFEFLHGIFAIYIQT